VNNAIEMHVIRDLNSKNILSTYKVVKSKEKKIEKAFVIYERVHGDLKSYIVGCNDKRKYLFHLLWIRED